MREAKTRFKLQVALIPSDLLSGLRRDKFFFVSLHSSYQQVHWVSHRRRGEERLPVKLHQRGFFLSIHPPLLLFIKSSSIPCRRSAWFLFFYFLPWGPTSPLFRVNSCAPNTHTTGNKICHAWLNSFLLDASTTSRRIVWWTTEKKPPSPLFWIYLLWELKIHHYDHPR